jgi:arylsulfatase A-like enzyme
MLLALLLGCPAPAEPPPDVLLVTWDTVRDDHLDAAPGALALAQVGVRFTHARTPSPQTLPAHASLMTGHAPAAHGVRTNGQTLPAEAQTLAESLQSAGYATGAFVSAAVLAPQHGLDQGFDTYEVGTLGTPQGDHVAERPGEQAVHDARTWLETQDGPVFVWVHLFDPHRPWGGTYRDDIAAADAATAPLLAAMDARGPHVVALTSDHGEGLGEHGEWTHGYFAYDSTVRVPLILRGGAFTGGRTVADPVSLTDVAQALLHEAGVATDSPLHQALAGTLGDRALPLEAPSAWFEFGAEPVLGWVSAETAWFATPTPERYDLSSDPTQRDNRWDPSADPATLAGLDADWDWRWDRSATEMDPALAAQLEQLGYLSGATANDVDRDPKDRAGLMTLYQTGAADVLPADALAQLDRYEALWGPLPPIVSLRAQLTRIRDGWSGDPAADRDLLERIDAAYAISPDDVTIALDRATVQWRLGDLAAAETTLRTADPDDPRVRAQLAALLVALDRPTDALPYAQGCTRAHLLTALDTPDADALRQCRSAGGDLTPRELAILAPE